MAFLEQALTTRVVVSAQNYAVLHNAAKEKELARLGKLEKRTAVRFWIYDETLFNAFYAKHCAGDVLGRYTVLYNPDGRFIPMHEVRAAINAAFFAVRNIKQQTITVSFSQIPRWEWLRVAEYQKIGEEGAHTSQLRAGSFIFENVREVTVRELENLKNVHHGMSEQEIREVRTRIAAMRTPNHPVMLTSLLYVEHIYVR